VRHRENKGCSQLGCNNGGGGGNFSKVKGCCKSDEIKKKMNIEWPPNGFAFALSRVMRAAVPIPAVADASVSYSAAVGGSVVGVVGLL